MYRNRFPQLTGTLFLSMAFLLGVPVVPAQAPPAREIGDASIRRLARAGAETVQIVMVNERTLYLRGMKQKKPLWQKRFPLKEPVNIAKTDAFVEGSRTIEIWSQRPFSAATDVQVFTWNGKQLRYVKSRFTDPSAALVERAVHAAERGDARTLKTLDLGGVLYPGNYVNRQVLTDAIRRGHRAAMKLYESGKTRAAITRITLMFDATVQLAELNGGGAGEGNAPPVDQWIAVWQSQNLQPGDYAEAVNDYGYLLQESGQHKAAVPVFQAVLKVAPARTVAHLNLADSLWKLNQKAAARTHYGAYRQRMIQQHKQSRIPIRVQQRIK